MEIKINVYENDMKTVKKEVSAEVVEIPFGIIRKFMALFDVENLEYTVAILNVVSKSWKEVQLLLDRIFPDMSEDDWDGVNTKELIQVVMTVLKFAFGEILNIPVDPKN